MLWSRKPSPTYERSRLAGLDLTASRIRGVSIGSDKVQPLTFEEPGGDLPLFASLENRSPEMGRAGRTLCRKAPHLLCSNFLPALGQQREWRLGRTVLTPDSALELAFEKVREPVAAECDTAALAMPAYLTPLQVSRVLAVAARARLPLKGTAVGPLALVADRAHAVLAGKPISPDVAPPAWVVPLRPAPSGPCAVVVVDADEWALSASVLAVERDRVRSMATAAWPRFSVKAWKDRLLDGISDRCVRLCRRDPRDSADAEQGMFEQLDDALDRVRAGQRVAINVRTAHWYQDVIHQPEEFEAYCIALARGAGESIRELIGEASLFVPPRDVWLTHEASLLPGLARSVHANTPEGTAVEILPPNAVAHAAAMLVPRWLAADLPRAHLDSVITLPALPPSAEMPPLDKPATGRR